MCLQKAVFFYERLLLMRTCGTASGLFVALSLLQLCFSKVAAAWQDIGQYWHLFLAAWTYVINGRPLLLFPSPSSPSSISFLPAASLFSFVLFNTLSQLVLWFSAFYLQRGFFFCCCFLRPTGGADGQAPHCQICVNVKWRCVPCARVRVGGPVLGWMRELIFKCVFHRENVFQLHVLAIWGARSRSEVFYSHSVGTQQGKLARCFCESYRI